MVGVRPNNPAPHPPADEHSHGRLNLLLTYGGWEHESWADRLPRLLSPMGVHAWRAQSGREAADIVRRTPLHAAVVDFTLPLNPLRAAGHTAADHPKVEESGARLLDLLARLDDPPPLIIVRRPHTSRDDSRQLASALRYGAFAVVDRPVEIELMLEVLRRLLRRHYGDRWPDGVSDQ